ncbi:hypothetical protein WJX75_009996 [Coccomyxa subellipsoidea]|uniref:BZIP domain-containing protein n=1 Tax=Coccomyxa subellipsoidea TaxID=248742 RepID=A0ABR2Z2I5_9CHLO
MGHVGQSMAVDTRFTDADVGDILDTFLLHHNHPGARSHAPSPFDPSDVLFESDPLTNLPETWHSDAKDAVVGLGLEHPPPPSFPRATAPVDMRPLQANTFTDVLASVAAQWSPSNDDAGPISWETSGVGPRTEGSGSAHGGSYFHATRLNSRGFPQTDEGGFPSPVSGSPQDLLLSTPSNNFDSMFDTGAAMSGSEGSAKGSAAVRRGTKESGKVGSKEVHAERVQQRKSRKREKDKIEELQAQISAAMADTQELTARNTAWEAELQAAVEELRGLRAAEESALTALADEELAARFNGDVTLTVRDNAVTVLSPEQIKAMTEDDMAYWWGLYIEKLTTLLAEADARPNGPAPHTARRIQALQREALFLHIRAAITNMQSVKRFLARGKVQAPFTDTSDPPRWRQIAEGLQLSGEQRRSVACLWRSLNGRLERILAARASLHAQITSSMPNGVQGRDFAVNFLKAYECMDALMFNLRQEHVVICDFKSTFHQTLTPVQNARFMVTSFPYFPDTVGVAVWIAAMDQDEEALRRLRAHGHL